MDRRRGFDGHRRERHNTIRAKLTADIHNGRRIRLDRTDSRKGPQRHNQNWKSGGHHLDRPLHVGDCIFWQPQCAGNLIHIFNRVHRPEEFRLRLRHDHTSQLPFFCMQFDGKEADVAFLHHTGNPIGHGDQPELGQHKKCSQHRMAGKWNLLCGSKNPEAHDCRLVRRR